MFTQYNPADCLDNVENLSGTAKQEVTDTGHDMAAFRLGRTQRHLGKGI